jgi:hypothetical protein
MFTLVLNDMNYIVNNNEIYDIVINKTNDVGKIINYYYECQSMNPLDILYDMRQYSINTILFDQQINKLINESSCDGITEQIINFVHNDYDSFVYICKIIIIAYSIMYIFASINLFILWLLSVYITKQDKEIAKNKKSDQTHILTSTCPNTYYSSITVPQSQQILLPNYSVYQYENIPTY